MALLYGRGFAVSEAFFNPFGVPLAEDDAESLLGSGFPDARLRSAVGAVVRGWREERTGATLQWLAALADQEQHYLRATAPWRDRTGLARAGLWARPAFRVAGGTYQFRLDMGATVDYEWWLETKRYGRKGRAEAPLARQRRAAAIMRNPAGQGQWGRDAVVLPEAARLEPIVRQQVAAMWSQPLGAAPRVFGRMGVGFSGPGAPAGRPLLIAGHGRSRL